jgi:hypothetical protein
MDVWKGSENVLIDGGTYKYNTTEEELNFFMGTGSHNTVILADENQMQRGGRFIWYNWTHCKSAELSESKEQITFTGEISCFDHLGKAIIHKRTVVLRDSDNAILVSDSIQNLPENVLVTQNWHRNINAGMEVIFETSDCEESKTDTSSYSRYYGVKKESEIIKLSTSKSTINTEIHINI